MVFRGLQHELVGILVTVMNAVGSIRWIIVREDLTGINRLPRNGMRR
jgi:hypothetical protein